MKIENKKAHGLEFLSLHYCDMLLEQTLVVDSYLGQRLSSLNEHTLLSKYKKRLVL